MIVNSQFIKKANMLKPELKIKDSVFEVNKILRKDEEIVVDLLNHNVCYVTLELASVGNHQDAPATIDFFIAENKKELNENINDYHGWVSSSWIQHEIIHIDDLSLPVKLNRRYAGRYIRIKNIETSYNFDLKIKRILIKSVTSAPDNFVIPKFLDDLDQRIFNVGLNTIKDCMQTVFEDGSKRDRRLWLGDLRLGALCNYATYKNNDLVKRCLYMFASSLRDNGEVSSNVFEAPAIEGDNQSNHDYTAIFPVILNEYLINSNDKETVLELITTAENQINLLYKSREEFSLDNRHVFIDWNLTLEKECCYYGVLSYGLAHLIELEKSLERDSSIFENYLFEIKQYCLNKFYNKEKNIFICNNQISFASQIWMVLGKIIDVERGEQLLLNLEDKNNYKKIVSPYLYHYYLESLLSVGLNDLCYKKLREYYGGMISDEADTFYEIYNPLNLNESPYGGLIVNSFCHIWSATPTNFLMRFFKKND